MKTSNSTARIVLAFSFIFSCCSFIACEGNTGGEDHEPRPILTLLSPADGASFDLNSDSGVSFEWTPAENIGSYMLQLSLNPQMTKTQTISATENPFKMTVSSLESRLASLGVAAGAETDVYWTIVPGRSIEAETFVRKMKIRRKSENEKPSYEERVADKLTVKVAILYEDPIVPGSGGKRLHEVCKTPGYDFRWNDPRGQSKRYKADLEKCSNGVIEYEIVEEIDADGFFSYRSDDINKTYLTVDDVVEIFKGTSVPGINEGIEYDYIGMVQHFGFDKKRDSGEIHEIWVYTHPACGMYESRLMGKGAFWLNSPGITNAPNTELLTVMFCNYERGVESALHSYAHRFESVMNQVYGGWGYDRKTRKAELTMWERYSGYTLTYEKFDQGNTNLGIVHFPPNGVRDYDYSNSTYVNTYADEWIDYPDVPEKKGRRINKDEWGGTEYGYMMWWFGHMPHFKGLNPDDNDLKLNNWWYYVVDYNAALRYERELLMSL